MTRKTLFLMLVGILLVSDFLLSAYLDNIYIRVLRDAIFCGALYWVVVYLANGRFSQFENQLDELNEQNKINLQVRFESNDSDIDALANKLNAMQEQIEVAVGDISRSAARLIPMSHDLADSYGSATQKAAIQDSYSDNILQAMANINNVSADVADSASSIVDEAKSGHTAVNECHDSMGSARRVVDRLSSHMTSSKEILDGFKSETDQAGNIVSVINGIAEQTNLLALNAAIEAARAGEQGRGFAVVADEVRSLAQRTRQSTMEVQGMLERIQQGATSMSEAMVEGAEAALDSNNRVKDVEEKLNGLATIIEQVNHAAREISDLAQQQKDRAVEVRKASDQLAELNRETLTASKMQTVSKRDLESLGEQLHKQIQMFVVSEDCWDTDRRTTRREEKVSSDEVGDDIELF